MSEQTYDYQGMIVRYWDLLRGDTSKWSSRPYFLRIIQESGEPGVGRGLQYRPPVAGLCSGRGGY